MSSLNHNTMAGGVEAETMKTLSVSILGTYAKNVENTYNKTTQFLAIDELLRRLDSMDALLTYPEQDT